MSAQPAVPGYGLGDPRNGMPEPAGYAYRGTGQDALTPGGEMARWANRARTLAGLTASPRTQADKDRVIAAERQLALGAPAAVPPPRPARLPEKPVDYWPAYYPGPGVPGRCPDCGYLRTARGHEIACGGDA